MPEIYKFASADKACILGVREAIYWDTFAPDAWTNLTIGFIINHVNTGPANFDSVLNTSANFPINNPSDRFLIGLSSADFNPQTLGGRFIGITNRASGGNTVLLADPGGTERNYRVDVDYITVSSGVESTGVLDESRQLYVAYSPPHAELDDEDGFVYCYLRFSVNDYGEPTQSVDISYRYSSSTSSGILPLRANGLLAAITSFSPYNTVNVPFVGALPKSLCFYSPLFGARASLHAWGYTFS